jgi:putative NADPH-quinone reductase
MKQWIDMVLEHNWAYGKKGTALQDKNFQANYNWQATRKLLQKQAVTDTLF